MTEFLLGVLGAIAAAPLVYFAGRLLSPYLGSWNAYLNLIRSARRLQRAGINNIIPSRSDYRLLKGGETIANYLSSVKYSLIYIGFWHAKGVEMANIDRIFLELLRRGCSIELVLMSNTTNDTTSQIVASYLGIDVAGLRTRIEEAWRYIDALAKKIPHGERYRFVVRAHTNAVYASCFVIDRDTPSARILVDVKIFGLGRESSFALELVKTTQANNLFDRFLQSFLLVAEHAQVVPL